MLTGLSRMMRCHVSVPWSRQGSTILPLCSLGPGRVVLSCTEELVCPDAALPYQHDVRSGACNAGLCLKAFQSG